MGNKLSKVFVVGKSDLSVELMLIDTLPHASIFQETPSPLTDDGRAGRLGVAGVAQGGPQTLGKKNECSHRADSPIPQSGPLAAAEFLHR